MARLAAWLGLIGFGGGYAVLAQLRGVVVDRRHWLSEEDYADIVAVAQSLPGASGANFFTLLGFRTSGIGGALLATTLFLLPSAIMMVVFGMFYTRLRDAKHVEAVFAGMNPAVVAIVASVAWTLNKKARKPWQIAVSISAMVAVELGAGVLEIVLFTLLVGFCSQGLRRMALKSPPTALAILPLSLFLFLPRLVVVFLRIGASTFGGGMAMIPILDHEVVDQLGWLTQREFSDAVTLGQITPGPVAITSTFVGYRIAGLSGAAIATMATFLPACIASILVGKSIQTFRGSPVIVAMFQVLAPVTAGLVAAAAVSLAGPSIRGWQDALVAGASLVAVCVLRVPTLAVLAAAAGLRAATLLLF